MSSSRHYYPSPVPYILLTWGGTELASLPVSALEHHFPNLDSSIRKGHPHYDVRPRILHPDGFHTQSPLALTTTPSATERLRKAATAVLRYVEYLTSPTFDWHAYDRSLSSGSGDNPLSMHLDQLIAGRTSRAGHSVDRDDDLRGSKLLKGVRAIVHVSRVLGCVPFVKLVLEHFLLAYSRQITSMSLPEDREEWREILSQLGCRNWVREELESRLLSHNINPHLGSAGLLIRREPSFGDRDGIRSSGKEYRFESSLTGRPELLKSWERANSVFAVLNPEALQQLLSYAESSLVPPRVMGDGELLDPEAEAVLIEIKNLRRGRRSGIHDVYGDGTEDTLRRRIGEYLLSVAHGAGLERSEGRIGRERW